MKMTSWDLLIRGRDNVKMSMDFLRMRKTAMFEYPNTGRSTNNR